MPDNFDGIYDPASVEAWAEELKHSCERFRREVLQVDCIDYPCLLVVRSESRALVEGLEDLGVQREDEAFLGQLVCAGDDAPELMSLGPDVTAEPRVDFVAVWPNSMDSTELYSRIAKRRFSYDDARIDALLEQSEP